MTANVVCVVTISMVSTLVLIKSILGKPTFIATYEYLSALFSLSIYIFTAAFYFFTC